MEKDLTQDTLQTRYRPDSWKGVIGQEHITDVLQGIVKNKSYKFTRSYIFAGTAGSGKTTTARILANAIICDSQEHLKPCHTCSSCIQFSQNSYKDYLEIDAGQYNKVEDVKRLIDIAKTHPVHSQKNRIILMDEAHRLSNAAWDSMLKLLEDGKTKTIFMFATTEGDKIRRAIHSRSLSFQIKPLSVNEIRQELIRICNQENIEYDIPSIDAIAYANRGRMRDAIKTLDMYYRSKGAVVSVSLATPEERFCEILRLTSMQKHQEALEILDKMTIESVSLGESLCNTISAIYSHPLVNITGVPEAVLQQTKTLIGKDIKKIIDAFMEYKPNTYEQVRLFLLILADIGTKSQQTTQQTEKRVLFRSRVQHSQQEESDGF